MPDKIEDHANQWIALFELCEKSGITALEAFGVLHAHQIGKLLAKKNVDNRQQELPLPIGEETHG